MLSFVTTAAFALDPLVNGDFETGDLSGWEAWGDETAVVDDAYSGSHAATMALDPTVDGFQESGMYQDVLGAVAGDHLQVTVTARATTPVTGVFYLGWEGYGTASPSDYLEVVFPADGSWGYFKLDFVVPEGVDTVRYVLLLDGEALGDAGVVVVDDLTLSPWADDFCPEPGDQADSEGDGVGDACDLCDGDDALGDEDADGICGTTAINPEKEGCGCASASSPSFAWLVGLLALFRRRAA